MHKRISPTLFALLLAAGPAFGQFEGTLEMKMTMSGMGGEGGGTMNVSVAKAGFRSEMDMKMGPMAMKMVMLQKNDTPIPCIASMTPTRPIRRWTWPR